LTIAGCTSCPKVIRAIRCVAEGDGREVIGPRPGGVVGIVAKRVASQVQLSREKRSQLGELCGNGSTELIVVEISARVVINY